MARCTLDDLVPSFKCKRIFLEPKAGSDTNIQLEIEACVYDTINDEDGIADYLFTDTFKKNIKVSYLIYGGSNFQHFIDFLYSPKYHKTETNPNGLSNATKALIMNFMFEYLGNSGDEYGYLLAEDIGYPDVLAGTVFEDAEFADKFKYLAIQAASSYQTDEDQYMSVWLKREIDFNTYTNDLIESYGKRTQDEQGNLVYELMIPRDDISHSILKQVSSQTSDIPQDVKTLYLYAVPYFDTDNLVEDVVIPLDADTVEFFYKDLHTCHILHNGIPASPNVQDFRMVDRIAEVNNYDTMSFYNQFIDLVSHRSENKDMQKSKICSPIFLSYAPRIIHNDDGSFGDAIVVDGKFFINWGELFSQNTKHPFLYENYAAAGMATESISEVFSFLRTAAGRLQIKKLEIYRRRIDVEGENRVLIGTPTFEGIAGAGIYKYQYSFVDDSFTVLTDGEYTYELETEIVDPMYDTVEIGVMNLKYAISLWKNAVEYIHNNPQNYNEMRDELNETAQSDISTILNTAGSGINITGMKNNIDLLFTIFCGLPMLHFADNIDAYIADLEQQAATGSISNDDKLRLKMLYSSYSQIKFYTASGEKYERRKIENQLKVFQDLLFAIGKFFEIKAINSESTTAVQSISELISFSKSWSDQVSPRDFDKGNVSCLKSSQEIQGEVTRAGYLSLMEDLIDYYSLGGSSFNPMNLGMMSPRRMSGVYKIRESLNTRMLLDLFGNALQMGDAGKLENEYYEELLSSDADHGANLASIKNNSGMFETFLANLGGTCENTDLSSTSFFPSNRPRSYSSAVDEGENTMRQTPPNGGEVTSYDDEDDQENLSLDERNMQVRSEMVIQAKKKEHIIMKMIMHPKGYSALDRNRFVQGDAQTSRYEYNFSFTDEVHSTQAYPLVLSTSRGGIFLASAYDGEPYSDIPNEAMQPSQRFMMDNLFIVYYLAGLDANMNPDWRYLNSETNAKNAADQFHIGERGLLCKLERYKNSNLKIGQGTFSDRQILSKYFYLIL